MQIFRKESKGVAEGLELKFKEERVKKKRYCKAKYAMHLLCVAVSRILKGLVQI